MSSILIALGSKLHSLFATSFIKGFTSSLAAVVLQYEAFTVIDLSEVFKAVSSGLFTVYAAIALYRFMREGNRKKDEE